MKKCRYGRRRHHSWLSVLMVALMLLGMYPAAGFAGAGNSAAAPEVLTGPDITPAEGTAYYIDSTAGNDSNPGTAEVSPWKTLHKVNSTVFQPGDRILLKAGGVWHNQTLAPKGSGTAGNPIIIDRYGSGNKPQIRTNGQAPDAVTLRNQQFWEIRSLDVSNTVPVTGSFAESLGDFRGIHVTGADTGVLNYIRISGVDVHDVSGEQRID